VLSIEGRAIRPEFQGQGLGSLALHEILQTEKDITAAASVTRNPAVPRLMHKAFYTVSPDLQAEDPLHLVRNDGVLREISEDYSEYVGADPAETPLVRGRYEGGLYGGDDPGRGMRGLPEVSEHPANGVIMVAMDRRYEI
jgi:hypothetical protein